MSFLGIRRSELISPAGNLQLDDDDGIRYDADNDVIMVDAAAPPSASPVPRTRNVDSCSRVANILPHDTSSTKNCASAINQKERGAAGFEAVRYPDAEATVRNSNSENVNLLRASSKHSTADAERLQKLKHELVCCICLDLCYEPCTLRCSHTFCKSCLMNLITIRGSRCPNCRGEINFPIKGPLVNTMLWNSIQLWFPDECAERKTVMDQEKALRRKKKVTALILQRKLRMH